MLHDVLPSSGSGLRKASRIARKPIGLLLVEKVSSPLQSWVDATEFEVGGVRAQQPEASRNLAAALSAVACTR